MKINPCPKCGSDKVTQWDFIHTIECMSCGFPLSDYGKTRNVINWNMLSDYAHKDDHGCDKNKECIPCGRLELKPGIQIYNSEAAKQDELNRKKELKPVNEAFLGKFVLFFTNYEEFMSTYAERCLDVEYGDE